MPIRIVLADDHVLVRQGLRSLLEREKFQVMAEASDGQDAVRLTETHHPDIVVLDISMPTLNGIDAARELSRSCSKTKSILLTRSRCERIRPEESGRQRPDSRHSTGLQRRNLFEPRNIACSGGGLPVQIGQAGRSLDWSRAAGVAADCGRKIHKGCCFPTGYQRENG
jgi:CheY-like chemotaxis protein